MNKINYKNKIDQERAEMFTKMTVEEIYTFCAKLPDDDKNIRLLDTTEGGICIFGKPNDLVETKCIFLNM